MAFTVIFLLKTVFRNNNILFNFYLVQNFQHLQKCSTLSFETFPLYHILIKLYCLFRWSIHSNIEHHKSRLSRFHERFWIFRIPQLCWNFSKDCKKIYFVASGVKFYCRISAKLTPSVKHLLPISKSSVKLGFH